MFRWVLMTGLCAILPVHAFANPPGGEPDGISKAAMESAEWAAKHADEAGKRTPSRWLTVYEDDMVSIEFDTKTQVSERGQVQVWVRMLHAQPQELGDYGSYVELTNHNTYFCGAREVSTKTMAARDAAGAVVGSVTLESWEIEREPVLPESLGEAAYEAACE